MEREIVGIVLTVIITGFVLVKLFRIVLMWNTLGFAIQHTAIDKLGLFAWVRSVQTRITLTNLCAIAGVSFGALGAIVVGGVLSGSAGHIVCIAPAAFILTACTAVYQDLFMEFGYTVGIPVDIASDEVSGSWS